MFDTIHIETLAVQLTCVSCQRVLTDFQCKSMDCVLNEYALRDDPTTLYIRTPDDTYQPVGPRLHGYYRVYTRCCGQFCEFDLKFTDGLLVHCARVPESE
jgi:hypothetical protein